jgi:hypothetical protein
MAQASLLQVFRKWQSQEFRPNLRSTESAPPVNATVNAFVATMVKNGGSPANYTDLEWTQVFRSEGVTDVDDLMALLEGVATWDGHLGVDQSEGEGA